MKTMLTLTTLAASALLATSVLAAKPTPTQMPPTRAEVSTAVLKAVAANSNNYSVDNYKIYFYAANGNNCEAPQTGVRAVPPAINSTSWKLTFPNNMGPNAMSGKMGSIKYDGAGVITATKTTSIGTVHNICFVYKNLIVNH